ncbi:MAG: glycosyltransferase [Planctomycetota bacterium]
MVDGVSTEPGVSDLEADFEAGFNANFDANVAALDEVLPATAECLRRAQPPPSARVTKGRDGRPTFAWSDEQDAVRWLGRTSMPSIRAGALIEAFQPGDRNVLLSGMGQGAEVDLLLRRLAPHQAVMVVDEEAWSVALTLRVYDFSAALRDHRLLVFTGPDAWTHLGQFLVENDGYLAPERMLSWPWFDAKRIAEVSHRLAEVNRLVAERLAADANRGTGVPPVIPPALTPVPQMSSQTVEITASAVQHSPGSAIAIVSNIADPGIRRQADRIASAAIATGRRTARCVLEDPAMVHPRAIERSLADAAPALTILLDVAPKALGYKLPDAPRFIFCTRRDADTRQWVEVIGPGVRLGVPTEAQRRQALRGGASESSVLAVPPAAVPGLDRNAPASGRGLIVFAEGADISPDAVGLHLASHRRLWNAAEELIRSRCDTYVDDHAEDILRRAERRLGFKLDSDDVRSGIVERIRLILGPVIVRQTCCAALAKAGFEITVCGGGWENDSLLANRQAGPWPGAEAIPTALAGHAAIVTIEPSGRLRSAFLDGIAGGLLGIARAHPNDTKPPGLSAVLHPDKHVQRFSTIGQLVDLVRRFQDDPSAYDQQRTNAANHVNARHTWTQRLDSILQACGVE